MHEPCSVVPGKWEFQKTKEMGEGSAHSSQAHGLGVSAEKGLGQLFEAESTYFALGYLV